MEITKEVLSPGDEFPTHKQNVVHTRVVRGESGLESIDPEKILSEGLDPEVELEVWYVDKETMSD